MNKHLDVLITPQAKNDIIEIIEYISDDNPKAALNINNSFRKTFEILRDFPLSGTIKSGIEHKSVRIFTVKKQYAVAYRIKDDKIEILRILSRYQDIFTVI